MEGRAPPVRRARPRAPRRPGETDHLRRAILIFDPGCAGAGKNASCDLNFAPSGG